MLSNEQRAHDVAIAIITGMLAGKYESMDVYTKYLDAYQITLEALNRDFHE